jgi:hypothetical protein
VVAREQAVAVGTGLVAGLAGALLISPWLTNFAFETRTTDPMTIGIAVGGLIATTLVAALPALRSAARIDPGIVIREG